MKLRIARKVFAASHTRPIRRATWRRACERSTVEFQKWAERIVLRRLGKEKFDAIKRIRNDCTKQ